MKRVLCALVASLALTGCVNAVSSFNQQPSEVVVQKVDKDDIRDIIKNDKMIPTMELAVKDEPESCSNSALTHSPLIPEDASRSR